MTGDQLLAALNNHTHNLTPEQCDMITQRYEELQAEPALTQAERSIIFQTFVRDYIWRDITNEPTVKESLTVPVVKQDLTTRQQTLFGGA